VSGSYAVTQEDVLLLIVDGGTDGPFDVDPMRLMKGGFLVAQLGREPWRELFSFRAYDYGPFDRTIYNSRDNLLARGLLELDSTSHYASYRLTESGRQRAEELTNELGPDAAWIRSIGAYVTSRSFTALLNEIYTQYPQYAERSVMRR